MAFVTGGVAFEFLLPQGAAMRWRRAILTAPVSVPEAAVNKDNGSVFRKKNFHRNSARSSTPHPDPLPTLPQTLTLDPSPIRWARSSRGGEGIRSKQRQSAVNSRLKKPPGEGTGPTIHADLRGNLVGRVPCVLVQ